MKIDNLSITVNGTKVAVAEMERSASVVGELINAKFHVTNPVGVCALITMSNIKKIDLEEFNGSLCAYCYDRMQTLFKI